MKRFLVFVLALGLVGFASSCAEKRTMTTEEQADMDTMSMDELAPDSTAPQPEDTTVDTMTPDAPIGGYGAGGRVHVVQKGDTLFKLARDYYNDQRMWKKIWQANQDQIPDPNKLRVGMELILP